MKLKVDIDASVIINQMVVERAAKIFEQTTRVWPDGRRETVSTKFAPPQTYPKERSVKRVRKSSIPEEVQDQFLIVEAAILSELEANFEGQMGGYPADLGGSDISQNALEKLDRMHVTDKNIVAEFMRRRASPEHQKDETASRMVMTALQSIRGAGIASKG